MKILRILPLALCALPCAFGYIGETFTTTGATPQTIQITHPDYASLQFYVNTLVVGGATSSLVGAASPVISTSSNPVAAIEAAMASWNNVGAADIRFSGLQTTTVGHNSADCLNVISIAATAGDLAVLGVTSGSNGVVGLTVNSYVQGAGSVCGGTTSVPAGSIIDSDILLNPLFEFSTDGTTGTKDVQAVVTHELGHVLGMNHSGLLAATMYPFTAKLQRHLSWDEKAFAATYYPSGTKSLGTISGAVTLGSAPVVYGLVTLTDVSVGGGKTIGTLTDANGNYSVQVPTGIYNVYAEPLNSFIGAANIYSLTSTTGTLNSALATTNFTATFSGGNTTSPPTFTVTVGSTSTANISVVSGATTLAVPFYGIGKAGASGDISTFSSIGGAIPLVAGASYDIAVTGTGIDSTVTFPFIGTNVTLVGSPRVDSSGTVGGNPIIRQTLSIGSQTNATIGSLWIVKGSSILPLTGILDLEPMVPTVNNILPLYSSSTSITSGQFVSIYGNNLTSNTRIWNASTDFTGGTAAGSPLPTSLDGVTVTVNSQPAAVYFISPAQINFIVPSNLTAGTANIVVGNGGSSAPTFAPDAIATSSPSFFIYGAASPYYVSAYNFPSYSLVGDPAVQSGSVKALPNGTVIIYATGLAPENGGVVASGSTAFTGTVTIKGVSGNNSFTATASSTTLIFAGLFQVNMTLPANVPSGNYLLTMTTPNGSTASSGISVVLPVGP